MPLNRVQNGSALRSTLITVTIVVLALALAATLLPRGFNDDLSRIGQGHPAVVLVNDKETVASHELMNLLNGIRGDYEDRVEFLVTDVATPEGQDFTAAQRVGHSLLVLFDGAGNRIAVIDGIRDAQILRSTLEARLDLLPP